MDIAEYRAFIASRKVTLGESGFPPAALTDAMKDHQRAATDYALRKGRAALFLDTGLGKSLCELEFARECADYTKKPTLVLTPIAVAGQMIREGAKFGIEARQIREQSEVGPGIMVANYERLAKLDPDAFGAVVLDESSILKSFGGKTRSRILDAFRHTPFKLAATATPSPNDHTELCNHAEFLGVMRQQEMLSKWFINDTSTASQDWRLKGHAVEDFWSWVASWSRCATLPSDLGGDDTGYILPEIDRRIHVVERDITQSVDDGMLFAIPEMSATSFHKEKRFTLDERCARAASIVFSAICTKLAIAAEEHEQCLGNQNTPKPGAKNINQTRASANGESRKGGRHLKTQNTCGPTTLKTPTSLSGAQNSNQPTTSGGKNDTQQNRNMRSASEHQLEGSALKSAETRDCSQAMEYPNLTMKECLEVRDFVAAFVAKNTKKKEERDCTSIIATPAVTSEGCSVPRVTMLLAKCAMILNASEMQQCILKEILQDPVLIFCETNAEQDMLEGLFGMASFSVRGSDDPDKKEAAILDWCAGVRPWMISKTSIVGFGMNFQHCANVVFASINFSYEKFYQGIRRVWRFGQDRVVHCHIVISDTERTVWETVNIKSKKHEEMKRRMADAMTRAQSGSDVRVAYNRPLDLAFPDWIQSEKAS